MSIKNEFPWLALGLGLVCALTLMLFSPLNTTAPATMPLLMALFMAELGFFVTAAGLAIAVKMVLSGKSSNRNLVIAGGNLLLAINLFYAGFQLWPRV